MMLVILKAYTLSLMEHQALGLPITVRPMQDAFCAEAKAQLAALERLQGQNASEHAALQSAQEQAAGKPVSYNHGQLSMNCGLL